MCKELIKLSPETCKKLKYKINNFYSYKNCPISQNKKVQIGEFSKKAARFLIAQKESLPSNLHNCLIKLCEFLQDFTLAES